VEKRGARHLPALAGCLFAVVTDTWAAGPLGVFSFAWSFSF